MLKKNESKITIKESFTKFVQQQFANCDFKKKDQIKESLMAVFRNYGDSYPIDVIFGMGYYFEAENFDYYQGTGLNAANNYSAGL